MHSTMFGFGFLTLIAFLTGGVGLPLGVPPVEDPAMMQVAPAECVAYITWSGMGEADATSQNSTEALMAGPEVQRILAQLDEALTGALLAIPTDEEDSPQAQLAKHGVPLGRLLLSRPTAIFLESVKEGDAGPEVRGGALVNLGDALVNLGDAAPKVSATLVKLQQQFLKESISTVEIPSAKLKATRINLGKGTPEITWAVKGDYLIIGIGEKSLEDMLARLGKPAPAWLTELRSAAHIERVSSIIHVDVQQIKAAAAPIADHDIQQFLKLLTATGLENVQAIDLVSGLDADGFLTQTKISLDGEAKGAATIVSGKPLSPLDLESIPADSTFAVAVRADARELYQLLLETAGNIEPGAEREIDRELRRVEEQTGLHIVDGIFRGLGDVWCAYNSPSEGGLLFTGLTATVNVRDYKRLKPEYDRIHALISEDFERIRGFGGRSQPQVKEIEFAGEKIHFITGQRDLIVAPSFCLTKDQLIFSLFPQNIKALLSRGKDFKSLATSQSVGPQMKMDGGPSVIVYQDARELFKMLYPLLPMMGQAMANQADAEFDLSLLPSVKAIAPHLRPSLTTIARVNGAIVMESRNTLPGGVAGAATPVIAGMYAPTIRGTWERAARSQGSNNLKQLALALHMYHDAHGRFPPAFTTDKEGNPLLSWRVAVLPYVEELALYREFHLDEPWDSEHNKKLLTRMPRVLRAGTSKAEPFKTVYLAPRMAGSIISGEKVDKKIERVRFSDVTDGTSNTIMLVEASDAVAVEWTKPDDLPIDPKAPLAGILGQHRQGFLAALTDGSVQFLTGRIDADSAVNLFNRRDGNPVSVWEWSADNRRSRTFGAMPIAPRAVRADEVFEEGIEVIEEPEFEAPDPLESDPLRAEDAPPD